MTDKHNEEEELLPWLANETLESEEREQVERYVSENSDGREELAFLQGLRRGVKQEEVASPGAFGLRRLQSAIRVEQSAGTGAAGLPVAANDNRWWKMSLAAAVMVAIVQGGVLLNMNRSTDDRIRPLSTEQDAGLILQIEFQPAATESEIRGVLNAVNARIVDGPSALGLYRIQVEQDDQQAADIDAVLDRLRVSAEVVKYVEQN